MASFYSSFAGLALSIQLLAVKITLDKKQEMFFDRNRPSSSLVSDTGLLVGQSSSVIVLILIQAIRIGFFVRRTRAQTNQAQPSEVEQAELQ